MIDLDGIAGKILAEKSVKSVSLKNTSKGAIIERPIIKHKHNSHGKLQCAGQLHAMRQRALWAACRAATAAVYCKMWSAAARRVAARCAVALPWACHSVLLLNTNACLPADAFTAIYLATIHVCTHIHLTGSHQTCCLPKYHWLHL